MLKKQYWILTKLQNKKRSKKNLKNIPDYLFTLLFFYPGLGPALAELWSGIHRALHRDTFVINSVTHLSRSCKLDNYLHYPGTLNQEFLLTRNLTFSHQGYLDLCSVCWLNELLQLFRVYYTKCRSKPAALQHDKNWDGFHRITCPQATFPDQWVDSHTTIFFIPPLLHPGLGPAMAELMNEDCI